MAIQPELSLKVLNGADFDEQRNDNTRTQLAVDDQAFQQKRQTATDQATQRAAQLKEANDQIDRVGQVISTAVDQPSYTRAKAMLGSQGLDVSQYPDQYDPSVVKQAAMMTLDAKQQIELALKQAESGFDQRLTQAKIGTEQAQAGAYGALSNQRNAAAGLNSANAQKAMMSVPMPISGPANSTGQQMPANSKPLPIGALKIQNEALQNIGTIGQTNTNIDKIIKDIDRGGLKTDLLNRGVSNAMNYAGTSTPQSRALASYQANLKKMVNDSLLLAKGVQTEGDAQRAADAILAAPNDTAAVKERLQELKQINERSKDLQKMNVNTVRQNYGAGGFDFTPYEGTPELAKIQNPNAEKIKAAFQAGKMTEAQARAAIKALQ